MLVHFVLKLIVLKAKEAQYLTSSGVMLTVLSNPESGICLLLEFGLPPCLVA